VCAVLLNATAPPPIYTLSLHDALPISNLGLLAKKDQHGQWIVVATDLRTAEPLADVRIDALDYQRQKLTTVRTDARGMATFALEDAPFMLVAEKDGQKGYL